MTIYIDGVVNPHTVESDTLAGNSIIAANQNFIVGNQAGEGFNLPGTLGLFQLDKVVRTGSQIAASSTLGAIPPVDANTAVQLLLNENSGSTAHDTSGNGLNGTLSTAFMWVPQ